MNLRKSESSKAGDVPPVRMRLSIYWMLFFGIALGMGYPRLDPSDPIPGVGYGDSMIYSRIVVGTQQGIIVENRVLVPWVAKPFYWIAQGRVGYWNPLALALMVPSELLSCTCLTTW